MAGGGYRLGRSFDKINLLEIWDILEDKATATDNPSVSASDKVVNKFLNDSYEQYRQVLEKIKLYRIRRLFDDENEKIMYYI